MSGKRFYVFQAILILAGLLLCIFSVQIGLTLTDFWYRSRVFSMGGDPNSPLFNAAFLSYGLITGCCQLGAALVLLGGLGILLKLFVQTNQDI